MTGLTLRERLNLNRTAHRGLTRDLERLEYLETKAGRSNAPMTPDKVQTSPTDKMSLLLATIADLKTIIEGEKRYFDYLTNETRNLFEEADLKREELEVVTLRYIECLSWDEIADLMFWSKRQVERLHGTALVKLGTLWHTLAHSDARKV